MAGKPMEDRLRDVESDVGTLKEWRKGHVDPHISKTTVAVEDIGSYIVALKAQRNLEDKLAEERHKSNTTKLNLISALIGFIALVFAALSVWVAYQALPHHSLNLFPPSSSQVISPRLADNAAVPNLPKN
jgi:hypothetical protein